MYVCTYVCMYIAQMPGAKNMHTLKKETVLEDKKGEVEEGERERRGWKEERVEVEKLLRDRRSQKE